MPSHSLIQAPLHYVQHFAGHLRPRVHRALDVVLLQLVLIAVVRVHHHLALDVLPEYYIGAEDAAQLSQEAKGVVQEVLRRDVDNQDQLAHGQFLWHVGAVQAVPLALGVIAALVTVAVSVVVFAVLVIQRAAEEKGVSGGNSFAISSFWCQNQKKYIILKILFFGKIHFADAALRKIQ